MKHVVQTTPSGVTYHINALLDEIDTYKAELTMYADGITAESKDMRAIMRLIYKGDSVDEYIDRMVDNGMVDNLDECRRCIKTCIKVLKRMDEYVDAIQDYF